jgi:hypothetical protein
MARVTVNDGITSVAVPGGATKDLRVETSLYGNETLLRTLDGTGIKQTQGQKKNILVSGEGRLPPGLDNIEFCRQLSISVEQDYCSPVSYVVFCERPTEVWDHQNQRISWSMQCREYQPGGIAYIRIQREFELQYTLSNNVLRSFELQYGISNTVTSNNFEIRYGIFTAVTSNNFEMRYSVAFVTSNNFEMQYSVAFVASNNFETRYSIFTAVTTSYDMRWGILEAPPSDMTETWTAADTLIVLPRNCDTGQPWAASTWLSPADDDGQIKDNAWNEPDTLKSTLDMENVFSTNYVCTYRIFLGSNYTSYSHEFILMFNWDRTTASTAVPVPNTGFRIRHTTWGAGAQYYTYLNEYVNGASVSTGSKVVIHNSAGEWCDLTVTRSGSSVTVDMVMATTGTDQITMTLANANESKALGLYHFINNSASPVGDPGNYKLDNIAVVQS